MGCRPAAVKEFLPMSREVMVLLVVKASASALPHVSEAAHFGRFSEGILRA